MLAVGACCASDDGDPSVAGVTVPSVEEHDVAIAAEDELSIR